MKRIEVKVWGKLYRRISKPIAKKVYDEGKELMVCPCKLRPGEPWHPEGIIRNTTNRKFKYVIRDYEFYHCNGETGWYLSFYIEVKEKPGD